MSNSKVEMKLVIKLHVFGANGAIIFLYILEVTGKFETENKIKVVSGRMLFCPTRSIFLVNSTVRGIGSKIVHGQPIKVARVTLFLLDFDLQSRLMKLWFIIRKISKSFFIM